MDERFNQFGLREEDMLFLYETFSQHAEIEQVVLYGSRAGGHFQKGSDVDLALFGDEVTLSLISRIRYILEEESTIPLFFDLVAFNSLKNEKLKAQITTKGIVIYSK
ncbi:MAG: nucleotidyltransferase domain-containing protein [Bacteroidetes bacterium]|nr:nucleotidyltransferase domain-containing protein [Bacteroidota bacterium]